METWKPISGYEGYEAGSLGHVRSFRKRERGVGGESRGWIISNEPQRILKPGRSGKYLAVNLRRDGVTKLRRIHQVVAETFIGPRPEGLVICHNDGDRKNNAASNLRYDTHSSNMIDIYKHGRGHFVEEEILEIRDRAKDGESDEDLGAEFCASPYTINEIRRRERYKFFGGPRTVRTKLDHDKAREIVRRRKAGETLLELAGAFGVSESTISLVAREKRWGNLT